MMTPKTFLTTVLKRLGGGSSNLVTFNINLWFPSLSGVIIATSLSGSTRDFLGVIVPYVSLQANFKSFQK